VLQRFGLRPRIAVFAAIVVGVALAIGAALIVVALRSRLDDVATTAAELRARDVAALAELDALPAQLALPGEESAFVQVVDAQGRVVASTENIEGEQAVSSVRPSGALPLLVTQAIEPLDNNQRMRVAILDATSGDGVVTVYAGESLREVDTITAALVTLLVFGVPLITFIVAMVTWWAVGRTLRPVRDITQTMSEITTSDLHRRVRVPPAHDEIGELAVTVNDTLARLDTSVETQHRFVADASHELRGPIAALRADLEISVAHPDRTEWAVVAQDTLKDVDRLQQLTDDLLVLATSDSGRHRPHQPVDVVPIAAEAVRTMRRDDISVATSGLDGTGIVMGDADQLRRMMRNLVHNAEQHAGRRVDVSIEVDESNVHIMVSDDGPGIPIEQRDRVFERFVRLDSARARHNGGTGLGLAIVRDVVTSHSGTATIAERRHGGTEFHVVIPIAVH
jgi:signal transduction histidine kinase